MPFPASFETLVQIEARKGEQIDPTRVAAFLERALTVDGASINNSDGTYFEFRSPAVGTLLLTLVRGGTIRTDAAGNSVEVRAEVNVRLTPGLLALAAFTVVPVLFGARPMGSVLSFLVSGAVVQFFYLKAVTGFWEYVHALCKRIPVGGYDPGPTSRARG